ncbi:MAG: hypothetical protein JJ899_00005, partial [Alphaproteobacteria bacterium]|nr:hypothetical protein [Alphaproteobacteria bacterium]
GLPVVITDWNGYRDTLEDGVQGIAVPTLSAPPGAGEDIAARYRAGRYSYGGYIGRTAQFSAVDIDAAADAYTRIVSDNALRRRMGEAGRKRAAQRYDWSVIIPDYEALWAELAARRAKDSEIAPVPPGGSPDLLRDDPFRLFAGYPSTLIDETMRVRRRMPDSELDRLIRFDINSAVAGLVPDGTQIRALLAALPEDGGSMDIGSLVATSGAMRVPAMRAILWMAKLGVVAVSKTDE